MGLIVVDRVRVPQPHGRPRKRPTSLGADRGYDSADFRHELWRRRINLPYLGEYGPTAVVSLAVPQRSMRSASSAGR
jgi:hypothetical protein